MQTFEFWKEIAMDKSNFLEQFVALLDKNSIQYCVITSNDSDLRIQMDERYAGFVQRAEVRDVLGLTLPVASIEDLMQGKVRAALDPTHHGSKRQEDLADIARLVEAYPRLREIVPAEILSRLE